MNTYVVNIFNQVLPQLRVDLAGKVSVGALFGCVLLRCTLASSSHCGITASTAHLMQRAQHDVVDLQPDRALPVVLALSVLGVALRETADAVGRPELLGIADELEDGLELGRVGVEEAEGGGEDGDVALVALVVGFVC